MRAEKYTISTYRSLSDAVRVSGRADILNILRKNKEEEKKEKKIKLYTLVGVLVLFIFCSIVLYI
tara:strand:+ start:260 stop:454 length:195 start_codon:yes stop_codon:yes gene_type:complete